MMRRPAIRGLEAVIAVAVGIAGGIYTVQPALEEMKKRHEAVAAAREGGSPKAEEGPRTAEHRTSG